jgi:hypothetical protein
MRPSIFSTFPLQEVLLLAHRSDETEEESATYYHLTGEELGAEKVDNRTDVPGMPDVVETLPERGLVM